MVFTVDHGDHLGQHRMYQKMEMYGHAIRVPLIVRLPGSPAWQCDTPVSHLDVMPTLLAFLSLPPLGGLDGLSLADTVCVGTPPIERPIHSQYSGNPTVGDCRRTVVTQRCKFIHDPSDRPELYDLESDPLEMRNLAGEPAYAVQLQHLHEVAKEWAASHRDWVSFGEAPPP